DCGPGFKLIVPGILTHPLKEVDGAAMAVAEEPSQVVQILDYVINGRLPSSQRAQAAE
ncbi:MAG TPA: hypothetical protein EYO33_00675, partial [Phycisphaerales bacterium]|nr:hypothetical protein [Phycisphaerales bacterium]